MRVGIDFGTSNTSVAYQTRDGIKLVALDGKSTSIPTAIFYDEVTDDILLGNSALAAYEAGNSGRLMRSIKSALGTSLIDESTQIGNRRIGFRTIVKQFLSGLIKQVEADAGEKVTSVTQGRPVSFNDTDPDRDAKAQAVLQGCLEEAGVKDIVFLQEPIAAAKSVKFPNGKENLVLVIDIGGGTSDFSTIRISKNNETFDVLASKGVYVGGNELDRLLSYGDITKLFGKDEILAKNKLPAPNGPYTVLSDWKLLHRMYAREITSKVDWMLMQSPDSAGLKALHHLVDHHDAHIYAAKVEAMKVALSANEEAVFQYETTEVTIEKLVRRGTFEALIQSPLSKMQLALDDCLRAGDVLASDITDIVLVGGSTLVPFVEQCLTRDFSGARIVPSNRFTSVAVGLAAHR